MATAQNTLSFFYNATKPIRKKIKECFRQRFISSVTLLIFYVKPRKGIDIVGFLLLLIISQKFH